MKLQVKITKRKALMWSIIINIVAMIIEFYYAQITQSVMLFSDGIHMLSHVASLLVSYVAIVYAAKSKNGAYYENWAAFINGIGLLFFTFYIFREAYVHYLNPNPIILDTALYTAIFGLAINLLTALILSWSGVEDINTRSAFLHMLSDTFSSVSIIVGVGIIYYTNWIWIDALLSCIVGIVVCKWSIGLIRSSLRNIKQLKQSPAFIKA